MRAFRCAGGGAGLAALVALCCSTPALADEPAPTVSPSEAVSSLRAAMPEVVAPAAPIQLDGHTVAPPSLRSSGGELDVRGPSGGGEIAKDPSDGFGVGNGPDALSVVPVGVDRAAADAKVVGGQSAVFANTAPGADTVVRPTPLGIETFTQIRDAEAPQSYSWRVNLPGEQHLQLASDGGVAVVDGDGQTVASVPAPWAKDANGTAVPARFSVDGSTLTMTVDHRGGDYAYPIVADPSWWHRARRFVRRHWYTRCLVGGGLGAIRGGLWGAGIGCAGSGFFGGR